MTLEIIVLILAAFFGILLYWRESKKNSLYRGINTMTHSKKLQMKPESKKGFLVEQPFILRLFYLVVFFIVVFGLVSFIFPFGLNLLQLFATSVVGTLIGTYIASAFLIAEDEIEDSDEYLKDKLKKGVSALGELKDKGKELLEDLNEKDDAEPEKKKEPEKKEDENDSDEKSARDKFKDRGFIN